MTEKLFKIRLFAFVIITGLLFQMAWSWVAPVEPEGAFTLLQHDSPGLIILVAFILTVVTSLLGSLIGRAAAVPFGALAAPVGLCTWVLHSKGLDRLLLEYSDNAERSGLFRSFLGESILWTGLVLLSYFLPVLISKAKLPDYSASTKPKDESDKSNLLNTLSAVGLVCIAGFLVLKVLAQSTKALAGESPAVTVITPAKMGQILFAIYVSFFIGAWGVKHLFRVPTWPLLIGPAIVALGSFWLASRMILPQTVIEQAPAFVKPSVNFAMALPLQLIAVGSLAVLVGHWPELLSNQNISSDSVPAVADKDDKK
jgi:hypothetical protein